MKATLKIEMPKSCGECCFVCDSIDGDFYCAASKLVIKYYSDRRNPDCPLIPEDEGLRWVYHKLSRTYRCQNCGIAHFNKSNYCPSCGTKQRPPLKIGEAV